MAVDRLEKLRQRRLGLRALDNGSEEEEVVRTPRLPARQMPEDPVIVRQRAPLRKTKEPEEEEGDEAEVGVKRTVTRETGRQVVHGQPLRPFRPGARQPEPPPEEPEDVGDKETAKLERPANVGKVFGDVEALLDKIVDSLTTGQAIIIQRLEEEGQYAVVRLDDAGMGALIVKAGTKLPALTQAAAPAQERVVDGKKKPGPHKTPKKLSPEYAEFLSWWRGMNDQKKFDWCKSNGVTWEESDSTLITNMRMSVAVQKHLNVNKYVT